MAFKDVISKIEAIGFKPHSTFRWSKFVQISTGKELTETASKKLPLHDVATIFFDLAAPENIGPAVMVVPLLAGVFEGDFEVCEFRDIEMLTPSIKIMAEMKLASAAEREDEFKRAKDLADLFALLNYDNTRWKLDSEGRRVSTKGIDRALVEGFKQNIDRLISDGSIAQAANMLKVDDDVIALLFNAM